MGIKATARKCLEVSSKFLGAKFRFTIVCHRYVSNFIIFYYFLLFFLSLGTTVTTMAAGLQSQGQRPTQRPTQRKRNRKRKRRNVSSSSSSSSLSADCASENSENELASTVKISHVAAPRKRVESVKSSSEEEESSSSDSNLESDSPSYPVPALPSTSTDGDPTRPKLHQREDSPPPPLNVPAPNPILGAEKQNEQALKERFQRFWMTSVADAFSDDLNVIRNVTSYPLLTFESH